MIGALARRISPPRRAGTPAGNQRDAGMTLVELMITMIILGVFLAMFSTSLLSAAKGVRKQTGVVDAQTSTRTAFELLDKQIRYADGITAPSTGVDPQWIEWEVPDPSLNPVVSSTQSRCYQWRATASAGTVQYRTWIVPTSGAVTTPTWVTVVTGAVIGSVPVFNTTTASLQAAPFSLPTTGAAYSLAHSQVGVALTVSLNNPPGRSSGSFVFTALNSGATSASVCGQVARV